MVVECLTPMSLLPPPPPQVFQPMLMEYFSYEELKDIKKQVMAEHRRQQQWESAAAEVLKGLSVWSQAEELQKAFKYADHEKTDGGGQSRPRPPQTYSHTP